MVLEAISRVREPAVTSLPCPRPSFLLVEGVIDRILGRYGHKLWPIATARPENVIAILQQYILVLMQTNMTSDDIGDDAVGRLDSFLGLPARQAEENGSHVHNEPEDDDASLECPLVQLAEHKSCSRTFRSVADLLAHLIKVHGWNEELAEDVANEVYSLRFRTTG
jgi:hypothetical protein